MLFLLLLPWALFSQKLWTLEECIAEVEKNNLYFKKADLGLVGKYSEFITAERDLFPNISLNFNPVYTAGRVADPTNYQFVTKGLLSNTASLQGSLLLYNGGKKQHVIAQKEAEYEIGIFEKEKLRTQLRFEVLSLYLKILLLKEQLVNNNVLYEFYQNQYTVLIEQAEAGTVGLDEQTEWLARISNEELSAITIRNDIRQAKADLCALMNKNDLRNFDIAIPILPTYPVFSTDSLQFETFMQNAMLELPETKVAHLKLKTSELELSIARKSNAPMVQLQTNIYTSYSNLLQDASNRRITGYDTLVFYSNNQLQLVPQPIFDSDLPFVPFTRQFSQNMNFQVGLGISIPISNGFQARNYINQASIAVNESLLSLQIAQSEAQQKTLSVYADWVDAIQNFRASSRSFELWRKNMLIVTEKFEVGIGSFVELDRAIVNFQKAEVRYQTARFDYFIKKKIIDYYRGKELLDLY